MKKICSENKFKRLLIVHRFLIKIFKTWLTYLSRNFIISLAKIFWLGILYSRNQSWYAVVCLFFKFNLFYLMISMLYFWCQEYLIDISCMDASTYFTSGWNHLTCTCTWTWIFLFQFFLFSFYLFIFTKTVDIKNFCSQITSV